MARATVLKRAGIVIGLLCMVIGLVLAGPSLLAGFSYQRLNGRCLDVFFVPHGESQMEILIAYEYRLPRAVEPQSAEGTIVRQSFQQANRYGQAIDPQIVDQATALDLRATLDLYRQQGYAVPLQIYYDADDSQPVRAYCPPLAGSHPKQVSIGMMLFVLPWLLYSMAAFARVLRRRRSAV